MSEPAVPCWGRAGLFGGDEGSGDAELGGGGGNLEPGRAEVVGG
jgi:hypothetical protein